MLWLYRIHRVDSIKMFPEFFALLLIFRAGQHKGTVCHSAGALQRAAATANYLWMYHISCVMGRDKRSGLLVNACARAWALGYESAHVDARNHNADFDSHS